MVVKEVIGIESYSQFVPEIYFPSMDCHLMESAVNFSRT